MADRPFQRLRRFFAELQRRNVYRVAATYAVVGFILVQVADLTFVRLGLPSWTVTFVIVLVAIGFPLALVLAWAFERTPEGVQRTPQQEHPEETRAAQEPGLDVGFRILVGLGLLAAAVAGGWYLTGSGSQRPETSDGTVAVVPFEVTAGAERWRRGMVTLLWTKLDGALGLRAIDDRTVLAAWERSPRVSEGASTEDALEVARQVGAEYAVVGSAVQLGEKLRFSASLRETRSGVRLGQVEAAGPPDSVMALADSLARRLVGTLAKATGQGLSSGRRASRTTHSLEALKSFLEAERHARARRVDSAIADYRAAVRADSGFALPNARLAFQGLWHDGIDRDAMERALELSDQLPERSQRFIRALHLDLVEARPLAARDSLRRLTRDYPDDPQMWYYLGELIWHENLPRGLPEVDRAMERAIELDPDGRYYTHLVHTTFIVDQDSALAAERIAAAAERWQPGLRLALDLAFGPPDDSLTEAARIDSFVKEADFPEENTMSVALLHPENLRAHERLVRRLREDATVPASLADGMLILNSVWRGKVRRALRQMGRPSVDSTARTCILSGMLTAGMPVPDSLVRRYLGADNLPRDPDPDRLICLIKQLIEEDRNADVERLIARLDTAAEDSENYSSAEGDAVLRELRSYRAWKDGDLEQAVERVNGVTVSYLPGDVWRGDVFRELGDLQSAEDWYLAAWPDPIAHEKLGQLYEEMDQPEKAAAAYRRFIEAWKDADEELQPRVEAARERLESLTSGGARADE